jgi:hypothetical protein
VSSVFYKQHFSAHKAIYNQYDEIKTINYKIINFKKIKVTKIGRHIESKEI